MSTEPEKEKAQPEKAKEILDWKYIERRFDAFEMRFW